MYIIAFIITLVMIKREWKKQNLLYMQDLTSKPYNNSSKNSNKKVFHIVKFTMQYLPIITLILISLSILLMFLSQWNYVCIISSPLEITIKAFSWICISIFQLSRLYYIFGDSRLINNNSNIKPYPNWLFILTFIYGIMIIIYFSIIPWINFRSNNDSLLSESSYSPHSHSSNSVHDILSNECRISPEMDEIFIFYVAWSIWFIVSFDWFILSLYFIKLCQFYKISQFDSTTHRDDDNMNGLYNRISYILRKIVCLTILYEIVAIIMGILRAYTHYNGDQYGLIIVHSTIVLERIILCIVIILMVEHNDNLYQRLMSCLFCLKCCCNCCCNSKRRIKNKNNRIHQDSDVNDSNAPSIMGIKDTPTTHTTNEMPHNFGDNDDDDNEDIDDSIESSSVPVLSIGSAPRQLNIMIEINH